MLHDMSAKSATTHNKNSIHDFSARITHAFILACMHNQKRTEALTCTQAHACTDAAAYTPMQTDPEIKQTRNNDNKHAVASEEKTKD